MRTDKSRSTSDQHALVFWYGLRQCHDLVVQPVQHRDIRCPALGIGIPISWVNRRRVWYLPYLLHLAIALAIAIPTGMWVLAAAYYVGIMSHPIEGWIVNTLGHAVGGRNFDTSDNSRNNHLAAWLVLGEGYQNNHHRYATSAKFSYQPWEVDLGYGFCLLLEQLGALDIRRDTLIPSPAWAGTSQEQGRVVEPTLA